MRSVVFLFLTFMASQLLAQDLIVKTNGDSLNCLITRNENSYMYFNQIVNHRFKRDSLAMATIKTFKVDYYTTKKAVQKEEVKTVSQPKPVTIQPYNTPKYISKPKNLPSYGKELNFFVSINAGISNRTLAVPSGLSQFQKDFVSDLFHGSVWGLESGYFIDDNIGFGLQFSQHISNVLIKNAYINDTINDIYLQGNYSFNVRISYFGPTFFVRSISSNEKHVFLGKLTLGYTYYSEEESISETFLSSTTGDNITYSFGGTYMYMLDPHLSLGASLDYNSAQITNAKYVSGFNLSAPPFTLDLNRYDIKLLLAYWF